jgi:hypothetical protein
MKNFMLEAVEAANALEEEKQKEEQARYLEEKRRLEEVVFKISRRNVKVDDDLTVTNDGIRFYLDGSRLIAQVVCPQCGKVVNGKTVDTLADIGNMVRSSVGKEHRCLNDEWVGFILPEEDE